MFMDSNKHTNGRLARWALQLQPFIFDIHYRPGKKNGNADTLSQLPGSSPEDLRSPEEGGGVRERPLARSPALSLSCLALQ